MRFSTPGRNVLLMIGATGFVVLSGYTLSQLQPTLFANAYAIKQATPVAVAPAKTESPCVNDWARCSDNADIANNYRELRYVRRECRDRAAKLARFGTPEIPRWSPFETYYVGDAWLKSGVARLIETDAKFQNGYGAMAHVYLFCDYDLRAKTITNVESVQK